MSVRAHPDAALNQAQLEALASKLADTRDELAAKLAILNRQITLKEDCSVADAAEAASLRQGVVRATAMADQHHQTIAEIDRALRRLESGRYGVSEMSGEPIPYERLTLIPWARTGLND